MVNVSGVPGFNPNIQPQQNSVSPKEIMQQAVALMRDMMDTSNEAATRGALMRSGGNQGSKQTSQTSAKQEARRGEYIPTAEAAAGTEAQSEMDDDLKIRKKNQNLRKKLETLLAQLEDADLQGLTPEEQETVKQFVKNAKTILTMQRELTFLEEKEHKLQTILDNQKKGLKQ